MREIGDIEVVYSDAVPDGTYYLMPRFDGADLTSVAPMKFRRDPWPMTSLTGNAAVERRRALDHLESLLDGLCERWGMDPDKVWREPRLRRLEHHTFVATERLALTINRPEQFAAVVP